MGNSKGPIYLMTDDEFDAMKLREDKSSILSNLLDASKNDRKFTTKNIKKNVVEEKKPSLSDSKGDGLIFSAVDIPDKVDLDTVLSEEEFDSLVSHFDDLSPIDDITSEDRYGYRRSDQDDDYQAMFKKEKSMLSDVLSDLQKRSKIVNGRITSMSGKGTYGVSKNFIELIEAGNSLDSTKLSVIKAMADIKKTAVDLKLKDKRLNPDEGVDDRDSVADAFYKQIIGGGTKSFLQSSLNPYASLQGGVVGYGSNNQNNNTEYQDDIGFNISQPIPSEYDGTEYTQGLEVDKSGYIANENRNVEISIYRYDDGTMRFVALDEDGEVVNNYELPNDVLLDSISTKPMSSYAYDKYGRKYKIIDINTSGADLSDLDSDELDNVSDDDKYNY